ncbi:MAG TPA: SpoIIE family protein phosphatase [Candidatus Wallbacteria bacterium]|nr:SpoIIE family protein phosphatase [Candidatus Wallbacteria bacterium]
MSYKHIEINYSQQPKKNGAPCGDVVMYERTRNSTLVVVSDGLGSGVRANVSATMASARLLELIRRGFSMRDAFQNVVSTMHEARQRDLPYAVLTLVQILNDGAATVLSYEMPEPVFIAGGYASLLNFRSFTLGGEVVCEANCFLDEGNHLLIVSDGVTQAGMGIILKMGWTSDGYCGYINGLLRSGSAVRDISDSTLIESLRISKGRRGDDTTCALISCRNGNVVNIMTGPPESRDDDAFIAKTFLESDGLKVVCGSSTAGIISRYSRKPLSVDNSSQSMIEPPKYEIEGIDLVTEGAVTLNQVYNILDEESENCDDKNSGVYTLYSLLIFADRINFFVGMSKNMAHSDIVFRQMGVLPRDVIVSLIAEKLRKKGKMVIVDQK